MAEEEFWYGITPRAFFNAVEGFESLRRTDLEIARLQTLYIINFAQGPKNPIQDPQELWKYPWEKEILTREQVDRQRRRGKELEIKWKRHGR